MLQNGKSVYSLWILIPSISYPFPRNVMWQRYTSACIIPTIVHVMVVEYVDKW